MRLIDADEMAVQESEAYLKVNTREDISPITQGINSVVHRKIQELIANTPTIEAEPVRHGEWAFKHPNGWACSECGEWGLMIDNRGICKSNYCPHCGAKMDGDDHDQA